MQDKRTARRIWVWGGVYTSDKGAGGFSLPSRHVVGENLRDEVRHIVFFSFFFPPFPVFFLCVCACVCVSRMYVRA